MAAMYTHPGTRLRTTPSNVCFGRACSSLTSGITYFMRAFDLGGTDDWVTWFTLDPTATPDPDVTTPNYTGTLTYIRIEEILVEG